jgi:hypothetical protein
MAQSKRKLPVGDAIGHFLTLSVFKLTTKTNLPHIDRQIESLRDALNTLQIEIDFSCLEDLDGDGVPDAVKQAETALDVISCDAKTGCCRINSAEQVNTTAPVIRSSRA